MCLLLEFQKSRGIGTEYIGKWSYAPAKKSCWNVRFENSRWNAVRPLSNIAHAGRTTNTSTYLHVQRTCLRCILCQSTWFTNWRYVNGSFHATIKQQQQLNEKAAYRWHFFPSHMIHTHISIISVRNALLGYSNLRKNKKKTPIHFIHCQFNCCLHLA